MTDFEEFLMYMKIGQTTNEFPDIADRIICVPGGWLFRFRAMRGESNVSMAAVFVPRPFTSHAPKMEEI